MNLIPGKLYKIRKNFSTDYVLFNDSKTPNKVEVNKTDSVLFLYETYSYFGPVYYFLFDNKIVYKIYVKEVLDEI